MSRSVSRRLLPLLLSLALLFISACGAQGDAVEVHEPNKTLVDTGDGHYAALYLPEASFTLLREITGTGALCYLRYGGCPEDYHYNLLGASVSELQMDIVLYLCDEEGKTGSDLIEESIEAYAGREDFADLGSVTYGGWEYRLISFSATAGDGTDYSAHLYLTTDDAYLLLFQVVEYVGSDEYITYEEMLPTCAQVFASVTFTPQGEAA